MQHGWDTVIGIWTLKQSTYAREMLSYSCRMLLAESCGQKREMQISCRLLGLSVLVCIAIGAHWLPSTAKVYTLGEHRQPYRG